MRSRRWRNSAVVRAAEIGAAAVLAGALAGAIGGGISAKYQRASAAEKLQAEVLLDLVHSAPMPRMEYTRRMIQAGILKDPDGSICMAFVGQGCPLSVLKPGSN